MTQPHLHTATNDVTQTNMYEMMSDQHSTHKQKLINAHIVEQQMNTPHSIKFNTKLKWIKDQVKTCGVVDTTNVLTFYMVRTILCASEVGTATPSWKMSGSTV